MPLAAGAYRYRPLAEGTEGWDVFALQVSLDLRRDHAFGPITKSAVVSYQKRTFKDPRDHDGIAGVKTQAELAKSMIWPVQAALATPPGLLRGLVEGESALILGNHTSTYPNGTRDLGLCMFNLVPSDDNLRFAFDGTKAIHETGSRWVRQRNIYLPKAGVKNDQRKAGRYAVLHHNWQSAADQFAAGTISTWTYVDNTDGKRYRMDQPAPWIKAVGVAGVETGYQWCTHYVDSKVVYCAALR